MSEIQIKKTMVAPLAFLTGKLNKEQIAAFTEQFCIPAAGTTGESKPREIVKLLNKTGEMIGRRCSITKKWLDASEFFKDGSMSKSADKVKAKYYTESKAMEKKALAVLDEARELTDPKAKLAKFEEYDKAMENAKATRLKDITKEVKFDEGTKTFDTIEALAASMKVQVITEKPKAEEPKAETVA